VLGINRGDAEHRRSGTGKWRTGSSGRPARPQRGQRYGQASGGAKGKRGGLRGDKFAKKRNVEPGRSKVYTSEMFIYKENLDPNKPSERKMRSRRKRPSDDKSPE
jgi:hypothetical protein